MNNEVKIAAAIALVSVTNTGRISALGYDPDTETAAVAFGTEGRVYHYKDVPQEAFNALNEAEDKDAHFDANFRGVYAFDRVEPDGTISKSWAPTPVEEGTIGGQGANPGQADEGSAT